MYGRQSRDQLAVQDVPGISSSISLAPAPAAPTLFPSSSGAQEAATDVMDAWTADSET